MNYFAFILLLLSLLQGGKSQNPLEGSACLSDGNIPIFWLQTDGQCCSCYDGVVGCEDALPCPQLPLDTTGCVIADACGCSKLICDGLYYGDSGEDGYDGEDYDSYLLGPDKRRKRNIQEMKTIRSHRKGRGANSGHGSTGKETVGEIEGTKEGMGSKGETSEINGRAARGKHHKGWKSTGSKGARLKGKLSVSTSGATASSDSDNDGDYNSDETGVGNHKGDTDSKPGSRIFVQQSLQGNQAQVNPSDTKKHPHYKGNANQKTNQRKHKSGGSAAGGKGKTKPNNGKGTKHNKGTHGKHAKHKKGGSKHKKHGSKHKKHGSKGNKVGDSNSTTASNFNYNYPTGSYYDTYNYYNYQNYYDSYGGFVGSSNYNEGNEGNEHPNYGNYDHHSNEDYNSSNENNQENNGDYYNGNYASNSTGVINSHDYGMGKKKEHKSHKSGGANHNQNKAGNGKKHHP